MSTHKGIVCEKISASAKEGIEACVIRDIPSKQTLADNEVRIEVRSASINFPELLMMQNKYQHKPKLPFVLCTEGAGIVREVGAKVANYTPGARVFFSFFTGAAQEELVLPETSVFPLPDPLSFSQGASFFMGYTTAYHGLVHRGHLQSGEWLLVTGAGGGMGTMAIEVGKAVGARVIAAASSDEKLEACKKVGADYVINYSKQKLKEAVDEITKGELCDVIYDPVGGEIFDQCVRCMTPKGYGRLLVIGFASGTIPTLPINMALIKGFSLVGVRSGFQVGIEPKKTGEMLADLWKMANEGKLKPYIGSEYPMEKYKEALTLMEEKKVIGKCCITFGGPTSKL